MGGHKKTIKRVPTLATLSGGNPALIWTDIYLLTYTLFLPVTLSVRRAHDDIVSEYCAKQFSEETRNFSFISHYVWSKRA